MWTSLCLCREQVAMPTRTRVLVLLHRVERYRTTNTGRIATLALANSELRDWNLLEVPNDAEGLEGPGVWLLYPGEDSQELSPDTPVRTLVVPDATWKRTRRMVNRSPELARLPRLRLPAGEPSAFLLRTNRHPGSVCTLEAVARALGVLEGPAVKAHLEGALDEFTRRVLSTRPPLPEAAWYRPAGPEAPCQEPPQP